MNRYPKDVSYEPAWYPIETAPKDNKRPLYLARFDEEGKLVELDFDGTWEYWEESWEMSHINGFAWYSFNGIEEPTHWAYQDLPLPKSLAESVESPSCETDAEGGLIDYIVSAVMVKLTPVGVNTQNKMYAISASSQEEAYGRVFSIAKSDFPEHQVHTICSFPVSRTAPAGAQRWELDKETSKLLADLILANDDTTSVTLSVGFIKEDDGEIKHGLRVYESEYPEEGAILLVESTVPIQQTPAVAVSEQKNCLDVLLAVKEQFDRFGERFPDGFDSRVFRWVDDAIAAAKATKKGE